MPAFRKVVSRSALALAACVALAAAWDVATYDADAWLADHARVKRDMAQGYANLDWMVARRGLDLRALDATTTARITDAHSRVRAFLALRDFVHAFGDPHLQLAHGELQRAFADAGAEDGVAGAQVLVFAELRDAQHTGVAE